MLQGMLLKAVIAYLPMIVREVASRTNNSMKPEEAGVVAEQIKGGLVDALKRDPAVVNATNNEPWYQSTVTWGSLVAMASGAAAIAGVSFGPEDQALAVAALSGFGAAAGAVISLIGRWRAKVPLNPVV